MNLCSEVCLRKRMRIVLAAILNNLAVVRAKAGNYREAESYCRRALEIRQKILGANHPDVAKQLANLAVLCQNLGKYEEVEWYYQRALEIYQTELGPEDPNVSKTKNLLANCYLKQGKYKAAEILFKEILQTANNSEKLNDSDHALTPHTPTGGTQNLWSVESGNPGQERKSVEGGSKDVSYTEHGGWHRSDRQANKPSVSETLKSLSELCRRQGKADAASVLAQLATSSRKGLNSEQRAKVDQVLDHQEKVNTEDDDDKHSVVSQPAVSTSRRSPSPVVMRRNSSMNRGSANRRSITQNIKKLFGFKQPDGGVLKVSPRGSMDGELLDPPDSSPSTKPRNRDSPSPLRGTHTSTPKSNEVDS